jgi:hypothetical protein
MSKLITPDMATDDLFELSGLKVMSEGSLNEGSELEEESNSIFFEPTEIEQFDTRADDAVMASLESRINDLVYLSESIKTSKGMNQTFALEAEKLLPGFGGVSIGYYTKDTTATRYKVSLEEISKGIWALIAAAVAATIAIIYKLIRRVFNKDSGDSKGSITIDNIPEKLNKLEDRLKEADVLVKKDDEVIKRNDYFVMKDTGISRVLSAVERANREHYHNIDDLLEDYVKGEGSESELAKILLMKDPFIHDILTNRTYANVLDKVIPKLSVLKKSIKDKVDAAEKLMHEIETTLSKVTTDNVEVTDDSTTTTEDADNGEADQSIIDIISVIEEKYNEIKSSTISGMILYSKLNNTCAASLKISDIRSLCNSINDFRSTIDNSNRIMENISYKVKKINEDKTKSSVVRVEINTLMKLLKSINLDLNNLGKIAVKVEEYGRMLIRLGSDILNNVTKEVIRIIEAEIKKNGHTLSDEIKELHSSLIKLKLD